jgi:hypothetical protein
MVTPPLPKAKFTLVDTSAVPFDFWQKTGGHVTLLFFGYTRCPDVCPLHMSNIAMALKQLPTHVVDQIKAVFVTTDPARDTPAVLRSWLDHFDKRFIGLTGSDAAIEAAQRAAALPASRKASHVHHDYRRTRFICHRLHEGRLGARDVLAAWVPRIDRGSPGWSKKRSSRWKASRRRLFFRLASLSRSLPLRSCPLAERF